ncbi:helix-turn-helix transcriptional regulator [Streptomyces sp. NA04227]|uniref:helix-turn-helix domain-containing protein n=1 Tax=Streptomyces sp. NA04227 TaxID=2742136 RepID=UPI0015915EB4|nr:helix-turn-helix transcriptional regulator [Streptomyces sp. NA04227]QKW07240.1 helix-turn-helix transcriptional regulator [Streptomyces sp. NA04227]
MPPRRPVTGRSQSPRARYAQELSALRRARKVSLRALGEAVCCDHSHLGHMEHGKTLGGPELAQELDKFYGTTHLVVLWELAIRDPSQFRERYRRYMALEAEAMGLQQYAPSIVPGLLQTPAYARDLLKAAGPMDEQALADDVTARVGRQSLLSREDQPQFRAILDEAVLRRPLVDIADWREQLAHLRQINERPNVAVQVAPSSAGLHGLTNTDTMFLWLPDGRTVAYVETGYSGDLVEETRDVDRLRKAYDHLRDVALSPRESGELITQFMEEALCEPVESM